jgi:hypothetical protein
LGNRTAELDRMVQRSIEDRGGITRKGVLKIPIDKLRPKYAEGGIIPNEPSKRDYGK